MLRPSSLGLYGLSFLPAIWAARLPSEPSTRDPFQPDLPDPTPAVNVGTLELQRRDGSTSSFLSPVPSSTGLPPYTSYVPASVCGYVDGILDPGTSFSHSLPPKNSVVEQTLTLPKLHRSNASTMHNVSSTHHSPTTPVWSAAAPSQTRCNADSRVLVTMWETYQRRQVSRTTRTITSGCIARDTAVRPALPGHTLN